MGAYTSALSGYKTKRPSNQQITVFGNDDHKEKLVRVYVCADNGAVVHYSYDSENLANEVVKKLEDNGISAHAHEKW